MMNDNDVSKNSLQTIICICVSKLFHFFNGLSERTYTLPCMIISKVCYDLSQNFTINFIVIYDIV